MSAGWKVLDAAAWNDEPCLECQLRRLQNGSWIEWKAKLAVQGVMSSQGLGTCGQSLWALGCLMALIGAHYATRPNPIALPNAG